MRSHKSDLIIVIYWFKLQSLIKLSLLFFFTFMKEKFQPIDPPFSWFFCVFFFFCIPGVHVRIYTIDTCVERQEIDAFIYQKYNFLLERKGKMFLDIMHHSLFRINCICACRAPKKTFFQQNCHHSVIPIIITIKMKIVFVVYYVYFSF